MRKACASCGSAFDAKRATAKYCSDQCRKRAQRLPATVVPIKTAARSTPKTKRRGPSMVRVTTAGLAKVGQLDSELGQVALLLAERLDKAMTDETGQSMAALAKAYRETLAEAVKDAGHGNEPLEQIRASAALKLIGGGKR